jgi:hypothetical protein
VGGEALSRGVGGRLGLTGCKTLSDASLCAMLAEADPSSTAGRLAAGPAPGRRAQQVCSAQLRGSHSSTAGDQTGSKFFPAGGIST